MTIDPLLPVHHTLTLKRKKGDGPVGKGMEEMGGPLLAYATRCARLARWSIATKSRSS